MTAALLMLAGTATGTAQPADSAYTARGFDPRLQQGIDLIYSLRFDEADQHFRQVIQADPGNPVGYFFRAMTGWWRVLVDLDSRAYDQAFYDLLEECIQVCDRRLEQDPMDFDAILFKGGAVGFRGRLRGDRGQYLGAASDGLTSLPLLEKSRELEPTNKDILFGQGIYNYFAEVFPEKYPVVKPIMVLLPSGNRQQGLQQLRQVAAEGRYARAEAAYFLAQIYRVFEEDKTPALQYLAYLHDRYPDNAVFHRNRARTLVDLGRWSEAVPLYEEYVRRSLAGQTGYHLSGRLEALYYLGKSAFRRRRLDEAATSFARLDSLDDRIDRESDRGYLSLANLFLGMTHDLQGDRDLAVARYRRVLALPDQGGSRELAEEYLEKPYSDLR